MNEFSILCRVLGSLYSRQPQDPLLVPLFISAFRRANDLAMAMEARCYRGGNGRTKMKPLIYKSADHMAYLITILYVVIAFVVGRYVPFKLWIF